MGEKMLSVREVVVKIWRGLSPALSMTFYPGHSRGFRFVYGSNVSNFPNSRKFGALKDQKIEGSIRFLDALIIPVALI